MPGGSSVQRVCSAPRRRFDAVFAATRSSSYVGYSESIRAASVPDLARVGGPQKSGLAAVKALASSGFARNASNSSLKRLEETRALLLGASDQVCVGKNRGPTGAGVLVI